VPHHSATPTSQLLEQPATGGVPGVWTRHAVSPDTSLPLARVRSRGLCDRLLSPSAPLQAVLGS
jgi:hypothetical protein